MHKLLIFLLFFPSLAFALPAQIVIIRHGEKPSTGPELDQTGCERAYGLPHFFLTDPTVNQYGKPVVAFAVQPDGSGSSLRPLETIAPSANILGLPLLDPCTRLEYNDLAKDILGNAAYDGKTVLMSWEHDAIPGLAQALGVTLTPQTQTWPDVVFDEAWVLDYSASWVNDPGHKNPPVAALTIIPENVLPGDNPLGGLADWGNAPTASPIPVPPSLVAECANNNALDALMNRLASPPPPAPAPAPTN